LPMQVSKHTESSSPTMSLRPAQYASILYHFTNSVIAWVLPSGRPPTLIADVLSASRVAFPIHTVCYKMKNPGVLSSRVLWSFAMLWFVNHYILLGTLTPESHDHYLGWPWTMRWARSPPVWPDNLCNV
jgi:hypothetical protein